MGDVMGFIEVRDRVLVIRDQQILLDRDVAELYGVETREVNQAVKNNPEKFPESYTFPISSDEKTELIKNFDRLSSLKHSTVQPTAFSEKGLYMLATILKSSNATQTTIAIVETFAKIRELSNIVRQLPDVQEESQQKAMMKRSGEILAEALDDNMLEVSGDETTIEVNCAVIKIKHTIKREKRK